MALTLISFFSNIGEEAACRVVGGQEFPEACGACDPDTCDGKTAAPATAAPVASGSTPAPTTAMPVTSTTPAPTQGRSEPTTGKPTVEIITTETPTAAVGTAAPVTASPVQATPAPSTASPVLPATGSPTAGRSEPTASTAVPTSGRSEPSASSPTSSDLYCFPPSSERKRYTGVWDGFMVEAKDSDETVCGPVNNAFEDVLVTVDENDELTLNFRYVNGVWYGSEVRILRESGAFGYGTFTYNIKEIRVIENGTVVDNVLPPGLVLGMFSWNPAHDEGEEDIYEVDIEISRWGNASYADAQFLLQPPVAPHYYRFETGSNGNCDQAPQTYEFTWLPTSIAWYSTAGGGQNLLYTTEQAIASGSTDRIQCIPSNIEARISLWSIRSAGNTPDGMTQDQMVQVVVDSFVFTPVNVTGVANDEACSKDCQCLSGYCASGVCASQ